MGKIKYIHGSEDSTDVDVFYVFDELPSKQECKTFCSEDPSENRNIIVVKDGVVVDCYKGTPDECNNSLLATYSLHNQEYPLIVEHPIKRDVTAKVVRAIRIILSNVSRSQYRERVKHALIGDFKERIDTLKSIDFKSIDFNDLRSKMTREDILKVIAFQIGQTLLLLNGTEVYTKSEIAKKFYFLKPFLYRDKYSDVGVLNDILGVMLGTICDIFEYEKFELTDGITKYNVKTEEKI